MGRGGNPEDGGGGGGGGSMLAHSVVQYSVRGDIGLSWRKFYGSLKVHVKPRRSVILRMGVDGGTMEPPAMDLRMGKPGTVAC